MTAAVWESDYYRDVPPLITDAPDDPWETRPAVQQLPIEVQILPATHGHVAAEPLYVDVTALLAGGLPEPPAPRLLRRTDGHALFYAEKVNVLFGDPECGKTMIAIAACVEALNQGRRATILDVDHNGAHEIIGRLVLLGANPAHLADPERFRLHEPDDADELRAVVASMQQWRPAVAVVDSLGEVIPMLGLSSNSPDDYSTAHRAVLTALANAGAAVIGIDHMPKSEDARTHGQTGTVAKRRAVNGASLRVTLTDTFVPGRGGAASLLIHKDRPGGLRAHSPVVGKYQPAGRFVMTAHDDGTTSWHITAPDAAADVATSGSAPIDDIAELDSLDPEPASVRDVKARLGWGGTRATKALAAWKEHQAARPPQKARNPGQLGAFPVPPPTSGGTGNTPAMSVPEERSPRSRNTTRPIEMPRRTNPFAWLTTSAKTLRA
jgi:hypothetical protein